jgi:hypothetical protein
VRSGWPFSELGIDPTKDSSAIRRAYAERLKAMDLDSDVEGYAALRNARDVALAYARQDQFDEPLFEHEVEDWADDETDDRMESELDGEVTSSPPAQADQTEARELPEEHRASAEAQQRMLTILFPGEERSEQPLTFEEEQALLACFETLRKDPRLEQIDVLASASDWFAQVIAGALPRSDVIVRPAAQLFGWNRDDEVLAYPAVAAVVARAAALDFVDQVEHPEHRLHRAWRELTKPAAEGSRRGWVPKKKISELLQIARVRHPSLEGHLDWYRVALWQGSLDGNLSANVPIALLVILGIQLVRFCDVESPKRDVESVFTPPVVVEDRLTSAPADIDKFLRGLTDDQLSGEQLRTGNPAMYQALEEDWTAASSERKPFFAFASETGEAMFNRLDHSWDTASYDLLSEKLKTTIEIAQDLPASDCAALLSGTEPLKLSSNHQMMQLKIQAMAILELDPRKEFGGQRGTMFTYRIPPNVVEEGIEIAGLSSAVFRQGLDLDPDEPVPAELACKARLSIRKAILNQPPEDALKILRDMEN